MSRAQVRTAVTDWVTSANVTNLNQVLTTFPKQINFQVNSIAGQMTRAAGVVFISNETEGRIAVGGAYDGWKRIDYSVSFQLFVHSLQNNSEDVMNDFDAIVDSVKNQLRSGGHRLGLPDGSVIWQAAEPAIDVSYSEPAMNDRGATETWASLDFIVTQMIQA